MRGFRGYPPRYTGLGQNQPVAAVQNALPSPNVDAQRYLEGRRMYYIYQTPNIASIAAGATSNQVIQFDIDSVFTWMRTTMFIDIGQAAQNSGARVTPLITLQITDTGSGTNFFNNPVPLPNIAGTAELPYVLPTPQFIQPSASLQFAFTSYVTAGTTYADVRVALHGFKVYGSQPPAQLGGM